MITKWHVIVDMTRHLWQSLIIKLRDYMSDLDFYSFTGKIVYACFRFFKATRLVHDGIVQSWIVTMQGNAKDHIGCGDFGNAFHEIHIGKRPPICEDRNIGFWMLCHALGQKSNKLVFCQRRFAACQANIGNPVPLQELKDVPCLTVSQIIEISGRLWAHQA